jgi:hypothetical protein
VESIEHFRKGLVRREELGEVGVEEGCTGDFEVVGGAEELDEGQDGGDDGWTTVKGKEKRVLRHMQAALDDAAEAGGRVEGEAKTMDKWQGEH